VIHKEEPRQSPTFVLPPAPPAEVDVSPAAKAALAVQRALLPVVTADNDDEYSTVDDDSLAAMIAAATAAADRAGVALQAGKDEVNACPPGERSAEALDKVFHLELAKSAADQVSTSHSTTARACVSSYPSPLCVCPPLPTDAREPAGSGRPAETQQAAADAGADARGRRHGAVDEPVAVVRRVHR